MTISACACFIAGNDPYCACEMQRRGLKGDYEWSEEDKKRLEVALDKMFLKNKKLKGEDSV